MLERADSRMSRLGYENYRLRVGDAYDLDYPDDEFDVLICNYLFNLLPEKDFDAVIAEFKRTLRPGGRLVIVNMTGGEHWYNHGWDWLYRLNPSFTGGCRGVQLLHNVEAAGFTHTTRAFISQMTFPSEVIFGIAPQAQDIETPAATRL